MKIVYLGCDREYSKTGSKIVETTAATNLILNHTKNGKITKFPNQYDLGIALGYMHLVPKEEINKTIWINIHPAPLPHYGGRNVAYHAIMNKENYFGATIHYMNEFFDKGDIISVKKFQIRVGMTAKELYNYACDYSIELLREYLPKLIKKEKINSTRQDGHNYYKKSKINNYIEVSESIKTEICALYYPPHFPKIKIGNKTFQIKIFEE
tara:strand:- start:20 stop:649 length:630 start_codon:yes stop_codon:yes gene_type:complete